MTIRIASLVWRVIVGGVFLLAAYGKWKQGINYFPPYTIYDRMVQGIVWRHYAAVGIELGIGLWMLSGFRPRWSGGVAGVVTIGFTLLLVAELWRESPAGCGCGLAQIFADGDPRAELRSDIIRNVLLLVGCGWLLMMGNGRQGSRLGNPGTS